MLPFPFHRCALAPSMRPPGPSKSAFFLLILLLPYWAQGAGTGAPTSAAQGYEKVQQMRAEARQMAGTAAADADLQRAVAQLESALDYLAQPDIRELSSGNQWLYLRGYDVRRELAGLYARLGMKDTALATLEQAQRFVWLPSFATALSEDAAFALLKNEPRFKAILATATLPTRLWAGEAIAPPYQQQLSVEQRVAGLSLFWAEARQHFVHFSHVPELDWNRVYLTYLSKVIAAESTREYYHHMMQLAPLLHDGHTSISPPPELADAFFARPPIRTALVQDKVLIEAVDSASLARRIRVGEELVAIDGLPVGQYAEQRVAPVVSASTPQDRRARLFGRQLLQGDAAKTLTLRLRAHSGAQREETVARSGYGDIAPRPEFQFKILPGKIAYLSLEHFESDAGLKAFERALPQIMAAKALILDMRSNGGGNGQVGLDLLSYLSKEPIALAISYQRAGEAMMRAQGYQAINWVPLPGNGHPYKKDRQRVFSGPVAVLAGPQTLSAAEDFLLAFDVMKRGTIVGQTTGGSTGLPMAFGLPGGGQARICIKLDLYPDGRELVGKGIAPHIAVQPSVAEFRSGRDVALERAIALLNK